MLENYNDISGLWQILEKAVNRVKNERYAAGETFEAIVKRYREAWENKRTQYLSKLETDRIEQFILNGFKPEQTERYKELSEIDSIIENKVGHAEREEEARREGPPLLKSVTSRYNEAKEQKPTRFLLMRPGLKNVLPMALMKTCPLLICGKDTKIFLLYPRLWKRR